MAVFEVIKFPNASCSFDPLFPLLMKTGNMYVPR